MTVRAAAPTRLAPDEADESGSVLLVLCDRPYEETTWHAPQS